MDEKRAKVIEETAYQVLTRKPNPEKWAEYPIELLEDQQELYLELLNEFNGYKWAELSDQAKEYLFQVCVYLAVFRTLLQAKRVDLPPTPLSIIK